MTNPFFQTNFRLQFFTQIIGGYRINSYLCSDKRYTYEQERKRRKGERVLGVLRGNSGHNNNYRSHSSGLMRLLLDTNIYVYMVNDQKSLSKDVCAYLEDPENLKYLSIVNLQELIIAFRTKKLLSNVWRSEAEMISFVLNDPSVEIDNTDINVIRTLAALQINEEQEHKDPFDHIIIAQAISHNRPGLRAV